MATIREVKSPTPPISAGLSGSQRAAIAQYNSLSPSERSRLRDELGLKEDFCRQQNENMVNGYSEAKKGPYDTITTVTGAVTGLGAGIVTSLALKKTGWAWIGKALAIFGVTIAGSVAGAFVSSETLFPMRQKALARAMNSAYDQGNEAFERVLATRMIERPQAIATIQNPTSPSQDTATKYSTSFVERHVAAEERTKDISAPRAV